VVTFKLRPLYPQYSLSRRHSVSQSRYGCYERKSFAVVGVPFPTTPRWSSLMSSRWRAAKTEGSYCIFTERAKHSSVVTATCCVLGSRGSIAGRGKRFVLTLWRPDRPWTPPPQLPIQSVPVTVSLRTRRPGREADQSPTSNADDVTVELYLHCPIRLQDGVFN
jgi:hypothetical protein